MAGTARCAQSSIPEAINTSKGVVPAGLLGPITRLPPDVLGVRGSSCKRSSRSRHPASLRPKAPALSSTQDPETAARRALRAEARATRAACVTALAGPVRRGLESALAARALPHLGPPGILGSFAAVGDEADPAALEALATEAGWSTAFPRVTGNGPLAFHLAAYASLAPGYRGIPEPPADSPVVRPDVLLVPLLAADLAGNRLGQGGGHYDRTLAALRAAGPILAIGIAWDIQLLPQVPARSWDQPLDALATPTAFHLVAHAARGRA